MVIGFNHNDFRGYNGISNYSFELLKALSVKYLKERFILFQSKLDTCEHFNKNFTEYRNVKIEYVFRKTKNNKIFNEVNKFLNMKKWDRLSKSVDLLHQTNQYSLIKKCENVVTTIHDLIPLEDTEGVTEKHKRHYQNKIEYIVKYSRKIFVPSTFVKNELNKLFPNSINKTLITYEGVSNIFCNKPSIFRYNQNFSNINYLLFIGRLYPRKNLNRIMEAFKRILEDSRDVFLFLVINGTRQETKQFLNSVIRHKLSTNIRTFNSINPYELAELYRNALCLVFPSLSEGFGLPILEAMKCKCPVITSNTTSMPEVAGDAAILVNPYNVDEIYSAMKNILVDSDLREILKINGLEHSKKFSWMDTAVRTYNGYKEAMKVFNEH